MSFSNSTPFWKYDLAPQAIKWYIEDNMNCADISRKVNAIMVEKGETWKSSPTYIYAFIQRKIPSMMRTDQKLLEKLFKAPVELVDTLKKNVNRIQIALDHTTEKDGKLKAQDRQLFLNLIDSTNSTLKLLAEIEGRIQSFNVVNINLVQENIRMAVQVIQQETELSGDIKKRLIEAIASRVVLDTPKEGGKR